MKTWHLTAVAVLAMVAAAQPARAADPWQARLSATWTDTDLGFDLINGTGEPIHFAGGDSLGLSLGLERRFSDLLGIEVAIDASRPDTRLTIDSAAYGRVVATDQLNLFTVRAGINFHILADGPVDLYLGPTVAWLSTPGHLSLTARVDSTSETLKVRAGNGFGWGGTAGADIDLGEGWTVAASYTYLKADLDFSPEDEPDAASLGLDPSTLRLGVGVRF